MDLELADLAKRDGRRDGGTDKPAYTDAWTHLKTIRGPCYNAMENQ